MSTLTKNSKPEEVRQAWTAALNSGKYTQGPCFLQYRSGSGKKSFCCLGVLSDLAVQAGVIPTPTAEPEYNGPDGTAGTHYDYNVNSSLGTYHLNPTVARWAGFNEEEGRVLLDDLENLNDAGKSFGTIADIIKLTTGAFV